MMEVSWVLGSNLIMSESCPKASAPRAAATCTAAGLSMCCMIMSAPRLCGPFHKRKVRARRTQMHARNEACCWRERHFAIDEFVVETNGSRILTRVRVIKGAKSRAVDGAETHRTRLAARIDVTVRQVESSEFCTGTSDGDHF